MTANAEPFEIIGAPLTLWLAPVGTAYPLLNAAPSNSWKMVGTSGDKNYSEDGVEVTHDQTFSEQKTAGSMGSRKVWRTAEGTMVKVTLLDLSLEQYSIAVGGVVSTTAAGTGTVGFKKLGLSRGQAVKLYALLARGVSPYGDGYVAQYEVPRCYQSESPKPIFRKGIGAGLGLMFAALEDPNAASEDELFGRLLTQHAAAL